MTQVQIISRILQSRSLAILTVNGITTDYFSTYRDEIDFIQSHKNEYGNIPDTETFLAKFQDFDLISVAESDKYLIDTLSEEYNYLQMVDVINHAADLIQNDSWDAVNYVRSQLPNLLKQAMPLGTDIISTASDRLNDWNEMRENPDKHLVTTGFKELDESIGGFSRGEELVVIFARTGQGKSWVMIKMLEHMWKMGLRVGLVEPEMSANKTGYRFDTLHGHVSNRSLTKGGELDSYGNYIDTLKKSDVPFSVTHPRDFKRRITVSKLRSYVEANKLDVLAIDGISYLSDERAVRGDNKTTQLTNISEDLMDLSIELKIPVIIVTQSNREGARQDDLELENIRDSDGISYNASLILAVQQKDPGLVLSVKKNRNGGRGNKLSYLWDIDVGKFTFVPDEDTDEEVADNVRRRYKDEEAPF